MDAYCSKKNLSFFFQNKSLLFSDYGTKIIFQQLSNSVLCRYFRSTIFDTLIFFSKKCMFQNLHKSPIYGRLLFQKKTNPSFFSQNKSLLVLDYGTKIIFQQLSNSVLCRYFRSTFLILWFFSLKSVCEESVFARIANST